VWWKASTSASVGFKACTSATRSRDELRAPRVLGSMRLIGPEALNSWARAFQTASVTVFCGGARQTRGFSSVEEHDDSGDWL
jgi:hypothetical protein